MSASQYLNPKAANPLTARSSDGAVFAGWSTYRGDAPTKSRWLERAYAGEPASRFSARQWTFRARETPDGLVGVMPRANPQRLAL